MLKSLLPHTSLLILQEAVHEELVASHLYKHLANHCQRIGLFGAAKFFRAESKEEAKHYEKVAEYLNDRGSVAEIPALPGYPNKIVSLDLALETAYQAEEALGRKYEQWYATVASSDPTTAQFLLKFLSIQAASIGYLADVQSRLALVSDDKAAVLIIDTELGNH